MCFIFIHECTWCFEENEYHTSLKKSHLCAKVCFYVHTFYKTKIKI